MKIPAKILKQWKPLMTRGDQRNMARDETQRRYINVALNGGECSDETFIIIRDFYNARIELLNTALPDDKKYDTIQGNTTPAGSSIPQ